MYKRHEKHLTSTTGFLTITTFAIAFLATSARAEDQATEPATGGVQDIIVTAQKRAQNLQDVPVAVSAFNDAALEQRGIKDVRELTRVTPGLQVAQGTGVALPFLRGIGSNASAAGNESSVAVYADGVYYTRLPLGFLSLSNIERVEVLKGPQGTLFGRNSSGGVINIVTPDPSFDFSGHASLGYGNYQTFQGDLYVTGGLSDTVAMDLTVGGTNQADGWGTNIATGNKTGFQNNFTVRSKLLWEPSSSTKIVLTGYYSLSRVSTQGNIMKGYTGGTSLPPYVVLPPLPGFYDTRDGIDGRNITKGKGGSLRIEQDLGIGTLTSTTAYTSERERQPGVSDLTPQGDGRFTLYIGVKQFTQELQLAGKKGAITYVAGLFYYNALSEYDPSDFSGPLFSGPGYNGVQIFAKQRAKSYAGYGQATLEVVPGLSLTGGLRYTHESTSGEGRTALINDGTEIASFPVAPDTTKLNKLTYRAAIDYKFTPDILGYASYSRGYKSGGYNLIPFTAPAQRPETVDAFEAGFKTSLFDRHLRLNGAAFYYRVADPQVQLIRSGSIILSNADSARIKGFELEAEAALTSHFSAHGGFTYLDATYKSYKNAPSAPPNPNTDPALGYVGGTIPAISIDASGNQLPLSAKYVFNVGASYTVDTGRGDAQFSVDYYRTSRLYFEPDNLLKQDGYGLLSAQLKYSPTQNTSIRFWGKNLLDKKYVSLGVSYAGPAGYPYLPGAPRTYGVTAEIKF
ncbi:iron complex outermembrane recepter protein [Sphingobium sp. AP50]|uniref:TonB-dependent receptor n=1 Tax=Sphingobium sp. AP50 TaxID=1884369 RepID=UPI0008B68297|nr:TonB-dependent receptor [Sphingobium sp. AP50]SEJ95452.1 iron complex outermembrane recepter protein [Sphingobium sp. AP50]